MFYALSRSLSQFSTTKTFLVTKLSLSSFGKFEPRCSYKVVLIKKKRVSGFALLGGHGWRKWSYTVLKNEKYKD